MKLPIALAFSLLFVWNPLWAQDLHTRHRSLPELNKKFSIVAHLVRDTFGNVGPFEANIQNNVDTLNAYFAPIGVSFEVCEYKIIDNFQYNILDDFNLWNEMQVKFHEENRINVFFVQEILWVPFDCGFTSFGGITDPDAGGIIMKKGCTLAGSKALTHEMGHFFGLLDTFQDNGAELVNGDNCESEGDLICDTPADPYTLGVTLNLYLDLAIPCRFIFSGTDANGEFYTPDVGNMMSYYPDNCRCGFSYQQYVNMANLYLNAEEKIW